MFVWVLRVCLQSTKRTNVKKKLYLKVKAKEGKKTTKYMYFSILDERKMNSVTRLATLNIFWVPLLFLRLLLLESSCEHKVIDICIIQTYTQALWTSMKYFERNESSTFVVGGRPESDKLHIGNALVFLIVSVSTPENWDDFLERLFALCNYC